MSSAKGLSCLWPKCVIDQIRLQIWTGVMVVVMCEDIWSDLFIRIIIKAEGIFIKFQLWAHKLFVKWVHAAHHNLNWREICLDSGPFYGCWFFAHATTAQHLFNSSPPSAAYMRQWIGSALVQMMAWRLFGAKPLSKPMLGYCQLDPSDQTSVKF